MKYINLYVIFIITILLLVQITLTVNASIKIILNFDDGYESVYTNAFPVMKKNNIPGVVFVITNQLDRRNHLSVKQLREMRNNGWEIGSHTVCHYNLEVLKAGVLKHEIEGSKSQLQDAGLIDKNYASFCSPMSKWNNNIENIVSSNYQVARGKKLYIFKNKKPLKQNSITPKVVLKNTTLTNITYWIKEAALADQPLVLVFHQIANGGNSFFFSPEKFCKLINIIKDYDVITFKDLYNISTK